MTTGQFEVATVAELQKVAAFLYKLKSQYPVMAFFGPMGAGKTTLIKAFCQYAGVTDEVNSPTFSLVNEYLTVNDEPVFHFDFYRIDHLEEAYDIGYENYFFSGECCLIEWPEKILQLLPEKYVRIDIQPDEQTGLRNISCRLNQ